MTGSEQGLGLVDVHYYPNPLRPASDRQTSHLAAGDRDSVDTLVARLGLGATPLGARLNGVAVERSRWAAAMVVPGDVLVLSQDVRGAEAGAIAAGSAWGAGKSIGTALLIGAVVTFAVNMAITLALSMLLNSLTRKKSSGPGVDNSPTTYSIEGGSNNARPYEPLPLVLGEHRIFPDYASRPFSEFVLDPTTTRDVVNTTPAYQTKTHPPFSFEGDPPAAVAPWVVIKSEIDEWGLQTDYYGDQAAREIVSTTATNTVPHTFVVRTSGPATHVTTYEDFIALPPGDSGGDGAGDSGGDGSGDGEG